MLEFNLPSLGADMDEGTLVQWLVAPGDTVAKGQIVAVVETTKAAIDVECWLEGTVHELLISPGEKVPVGTLIATLLAPGEAPPAPASGEAPAASARGEAAPGPVRAPVPGASPAPTPESESEPESEPEPEPEPAADAAVPAGRRRVSPAARRRAAELGIDVATVPASGPDDTVMLTDIERVATGQQPVPTPGATPADRQAELRRAIGAAMSRSKREIPHYYLAETVAMGRATAWLTAANAERPITERLVMAVLQLKAVAVALADFPELNGHVVDGEFRPAADAHLGVAISLRGGGLVAPAIHDVRHLALPDLMAAMLDLVQRARAGALRSSEMADATITVTNLGDQGVETVFPVIHPPQVAIVGFGTVAPRPWVEAGALTVMPTVMATLAADHRVSDGHRGGLFLAALRDLLQRPEDL
ncbi:dihydrolipoamide acetyltransferase family protein [Raineyella sp.]|uniref:dihydrolipoamide acetyltransferase family protein n=1 Tax=Raineyella sp. TaxID=1911550 RepID=UPI002B1F7DE1|nr:dihydrolipoamide acetyltransferase family protein [Raineyella sp.]MEA5153471.1 dihydrolipoamide acetyltransferase family protein [Raineyella sp.]